MIFFTPKHMSMYACIYIHIYKYIIESLIKKLHSTVKKIKSIHFLLVPIAYDGFDI